MDNQVWIRIQTNNYCQLKGQDELIAELQKLCPVQDRKEWYPSFCTGLEFLLSLNFNLSLVDFLNNVLIPQAESYLLCETLKKIWHVFTEFLKKNEEYDLQRLKLTFNDVDIKVVNSPSYGELLELYKSFPRHFDILRKKDIEGISEIELPYKMEIDENENEQRFSKSNWDEKELWWKIKYYLGCETCCYNPSTEEIKSYA